MRSAVLPAALVLLAAAAPPPDTPDQRRAIAGDPVAGPQRLRLLAVPKPTGAARPLFNGRDLADWTPWLGYADPAVTYTKPPISPLGTSRPADDMFGVRTEDGRPALYVNGRIWGSLVHKADLANYHLRLQYKWGRATYAPRVSEPQNNGLLYHSHGAPGAVHGTWMAATEFEIMRGSVGMVVPVGDDMRVRTTVARDPAIIYPHRRFRIGGRPVDVTTSQPAWNVEAASDAEKPVGEWNTLDLYVLGNRAVHVVNGIPVMVLDEIGELDAGGVRRPLTHGHVQLQSEGAETYFRDIVVEPIASLPQVVVAQ